MKALVIGGGGHVGNAIARALLDRGWQVTACGRRPVPPLNLSDLPVTYLVGDADAAGQLDEWIPGHELVVDGAAPYPMSLIFPGREPEPSPFLVAERRTRRMLDAVSRHDALLVYVGSFVTMVSPQTQAQRVRSEMIRFTLPYFEVKELIESQVLDATRQGRLRAILINPTYCLGPWDLHDRRVCTIPLLLTGEIPGWISQMLNVIDVRDLAAALMLAIDTQRYGEPLLMTGYTISSPEFYGLVCQIAGVPPPRFATAATLALVGSFWSEVMFSIFRQQTPIISAGMMMATAIDHLDKNSALLELGITPRPLSETIDDAIKWYRRIGYC
jgi:dihydroflavonol-4-reductase